MCWEYKNMKCQSIRFGRAFTTNEKNSYREICAEAKKELGIKDTTMIAFDFGMPAEKGNDTGIGSTLSDNAQKFANFSKDMFGINSLQVNPQGFIEKDTYYCPYGGSNFALGEHIIDLVKLTKDDYENILDQKSLKKIVDYYKKSPDDVSEVNYDKVIGQKNNQSQTFALKKAYKNFKNLNEDNILKKEFDEFKTKNKVWLEKFALYEVLRKKNDYTDFSQWNDIEKNLYDKQTPKEERQQYITKLKSENADFIDYKDFCQFIADKQQKEAKKAFNKKGIDIYGDCIIGHSRQELWAFKPLFLENHYLGCTDTVFNPETQQNETKINGWGLPAFDYAKFARKKSEGSIGKFLSKKFGMFFKRYDKVRIDAAWQHTEPCVYVTTDNKNKQVYKGLNLGVDIFNIAEKEAKKAYGSGAEQRVMLELLGGDSYGTFMTLRENGKKFKHIHTTRWADNRWGRPAFYSSGGNDPYQQYTPDGYTIGIGSHDDWTLINLAEKCDYYKNRQLEIVNPFDSSISSEKKSQIEMDNEHTKKYQQQSECLVNDLKLGINPAEMTKQEYRDAKFAELFTTSNQYFTYTDAFGIKKPINVANTIGDNWEVRLPENYEKFYHTQVSKGYGLNLADALRTALIAKGSQNVELVNKLGTAAEVLRKDGPMTEQEANKLIYEDRL